MNAVEGTFIQLDPQTLMWKPNPSSWSIAECLEHVCLTHAGYLKQLFELPTVESHQSLSPYKPSWAGSLLIKYIRPENKRKITAPRSFRPALSEHNDPKRILQDFLEQSSALIELLSKGGRLDWNMKVNTILGSLARIKAGDALRLIPLHTLRHIQQAHRVLKLWDQQQKV